MTGAAELHSPSIRATSVLAISYDWPPTRYLRRSPSSQQASTRRVRPNVKWRVTVAQAGLAKPRSSATIRMPQEITADFLADARTRSLGRLASGSLSSPGRGSEPSPAPPRRPRVGQDTPTPCSLPYTSRRLADTTPARIAPELRARAVGVPALGKWLSDRGVLGLQPSGGWNCARRGRTGSACAGRNSPAILVSVGDYRLVSQSHSGSPRPVGRCSEADVWAGPLLLVLALPLDLPRGHACTSGCL